MRYFVRFSYLGSDFHGSQLQPNAITVQETMQNVFNTIMRCNIALTFAGRTDAGVHAEEMWAHFDVPDEIKPDIYLGRINSLLPASIAVQEFIRVRDDAHARFSATSRTYQYRIIDCKNPFTQGLVTYVCPGLDFDKMNKAAALLLGRHNFASFCKVHTDVKTTFCTVTQAQWNNNIFTIQADRFLRNMVRAIVGTLIDVGRGKISSDDFKTIIDACNRCAAGQSAPPEGLYLTHIDYDPLIFIQV